MMILQQYPGIWGLPSLSPFCVKVETYLKIVGLPYTVEYINNPNKGPKGKMPVLHDNGKVIPDSSFIIDYLKQQYGDVLDQHLSDNQKAQAHAIQRMVEENLYFVGLYSRWIDPEGKDFIDKEFRPFFPKWIAGLALAMIRRNLRTQAYKQGIGRHTRDEIYAIGVKDINALSVLLGQKAFLLDDEFHAIDATVYAFLITILLTPLDNPLQRAVKAHDNLMGYCKRINEKLSPSV